LKVRLNDSLSNDRSLNFVFQSKGIEGSLDKAQIEIYNRISSENMDYDQLAQQLLHSNEVAASENGPNVITYISNDKVDPGELDETSSFGVSS
jgi:hypothetical protein